MSRVGALSVGEYRDDEVVDRLVVGRSFHEFVDFQLVYRSFIEGIVSVPIVRDHEERCQ